MMLTWLAGFVRPTRKRGFGRAIENLGPTSESSVGQANPRLRVGLTSGLMIAYCLLLFGQGIASRGLWASHEARAAQNAQTMLDDGTIVPRLYDGTTELQKPPGYYWLVAALSAPTGEVDAVTVRLPAIIAGLLTALMLQWHLRHRPVAGFLAAAMLASAVHFTGTARIARIDVPLTCIVTATMLVSRGLVAKRGPRVGEAHTRTACGHGAALGILGGCALLMKGPIGIVLPAAALGVVALVERWPLRRLILPTLTATVIALAIALPVYLYLDAVTDGEFLRTFILYHHFNRAFGGAAALAGHPPYFYLYRFAPDFLPWTPLFLAALIARKWRGDADARFGLLWFAAMLAVLSLSRFKRADYLLPAYPGAAIFVGCACEQWLASLKRKRRNAVPFAYASGSLLLVALPLGWFVFDRVDTEPHRRDVSAFAAEVRRHTDEPLTFFRLESHQLAFLAGRPVHTLTAWADLDAGLVVTRADVLDELRRHADFEIILRDDSLHRPLVLLRIHRTWPTPPTD